jgi:5'-methylthioadenosine phosphorylase
VNATAKLALLGGSGLYDLAGLEAIDEHRPTTPYGPPSDAIRIGRICGRSVAFLARHGRNHHLLPSEIDYRANIHALKQLGVERIVSASAVGSLRESIHPRELVLVDQFIDQTRRREATFFGDGVVAHVSLADPVCSALRGSLLESAKEAGATVHDGGTYLCMEGPAFSSRAESRLYRLWGADVIGMTNATEAKLAREAEICYATLALVTDYDCWHEDEADVSVAVLLDNLRANAQLAAAVLTSALDRLPATGDCPCRSALDHAVLTPREAIPAEARERLAPLLSRYLSTP